MYGQTKSPGDPGLLLFRPSVKRLSHNPKVAGSIPAPAIEKGLAIETSERPEVSSSTARRGLISFDREGRTTQPLLSMRSTRFWFRDPEGNALMAGLRREFATGARSPARAEPPSQRDVAIADGRRDTRRT